MSDPDWLKFSKNGNFNYYLDSSNNTGFINYNDGDCEYKVIVNDNTLTTAKLNALASSIIEIKKQKDLITAQGFDIACSISYKY